MKIAYTKPSITKLEIDYATDAATNGWGDSCYDYIIRFEKEFSEYVNMKFGIATSSCTGAMTMGLHALGIKEGDEVILADTNWIATAAPICHSGAKPVFVDILPDTWCIDPLKAESAITKNTKAIIATHLYGNLCDMDAFLEIGKRHNIAIIEDAAEAIGSIYKGKRAGSMGTFSTFSFHGTKTLTTGEGGMFLTNDLKLFERVLTLSNHGRARQQTKQFWADMIGFKFKMSNLQASIGCAQLKRIRELTQRKQQILKNYKYLSRDIPNIKFNPYYHDITNGAWMPTVVFGEDTGIKLEKIQSTFKRNNIDARVFFWPLSSLEMFETNSKNINAYSISQRAINLPSFHDITDEEQSRVVDTIKSLYEKI